MKKLLIICAVFLITFTGCGENRVYANIPIINNNMASTTGTDEDISQTTVSAQDNTAANKTEMSDDYDIAQEQALTANDTIAYQSETSEAPADDAVPAPIAIEQTTALASEYEAPHTSENTDISNADVIEIKEKMFVTQTNDIYYNADDYLGKTLKYEGVFDVYEVPETGEKFYAVFRYGPGCCGIDANAGFEVKWDKDYPNQNDWVEAVGVLEKYEENGFQYLRLSLNSLTVLTTRGAEYVAQ